MATNNAPFSMPSEPQNGRELLWWAFFEPVLLMRFSDTLTRKDAVRWFVRAYPWIVLLALLLWGGGMGLVVIVDPPAMFPQSYTVEFLNSWQQSASPAIRLGVLSASTWDDFVVVLALVLGFGLGFVVVGGLVGGLGLGVVGLFGGLGGGLVGDLGVGLVVGLVSGLVFVVVFGPVSGLGFGVGVVFGVVFGIVGGLGFGLIDGPGVGLVFIPAFYFGYFRLLFAPVYILMGFGPVALTHNPYCRDGVIWLPLWPTDAKLLRVAGQQPEDARAFIDFLLEYRPLQKRFAARLTHAATAGIWKQGAHMLQVNAFFSPTIQEEQMKFQPSEHWLSDLAQARTQLRTSQQHTQIGLKAAAFEEFLTHLQSLREQTLRESPKWNRFYLEPLDLWLKVATERLDTLHQQTAMLEPITSNIYRSGEALHPGSDADIFVGREDLKDTLAFEILTARVMPMFLIQGQRRVGKTSLLNFLPELLGPQFQVVFQDMQSERTAGVLHWLKDLRRKLNTQFHIKEDAWSPPQDWLEAWGQMREHLEEICQQQRCKIILAFDEYERFHANFQEDPAQAEKLLGAMRHFSQHQNQVVFLFVGAKFFSELESPNWNEYFVQVKHLRVNYLKEADTLKLITRPVPEFNLVYPDDVAQRIFDLTQGHPALVQKTCSELVNLANRSNHKHMTHDDLDTVLHSVDNAILSRESSPFSEFWSQFCSKHAPATAAHRVTLRQILNGETPTDKVSLFRLEQHGYIVQDGDAWKIRVPLFEMWLRKYAETFA